MPKRSLTQLFVERIGPPKSGRVEYWDTHLPGFGLRVSATGVKSWQVFLRVHGGKQVRETLGTVDAIPEVDVARARALASQKKARAGINPVEERRAAAVRTDTEDFASVAGRFLAEHVDRNLRPKTIREWRRLFESELIPRLGTRAIREITKANVLELLNEKAETRPKQADEIRKVLRRLFSWAIEESVLTDDPTEGVTKRVKERQDRERVLTPAEIKLFWSGCDRLGWPFGPLCQLLLLTAQREGEVGGARWSEFDLPGRVWNIPGARTKNGKAHTVQLSDFAIEILDSLPRTGELLFASRGTAPSGYSKVKTRLDGYMADAGAEIPGWVFHDLRRTAATNMARLGIAQPVVEKVLNHISGQVSGIGGIYNRHDYGAEREYALGALAMFVKLLVRDNLPGHIAEARVKLWLRAERERAEREAAGDVVVPLAAHAATA